jgi:hypothetical protein
VYDADEPGSGVPYAVVEKLGDDVGSEKASCVELRA